MISIHTLSFFWCEKRNNVLHEEAAQRGHIEIVKLRLTHAEEKKTDVNVCKECQSSITKKDPELTASNEALKWDKTDDHF